VAERNYGGEIVESTIRSVDELVPVRMVSASRGKVQRAEPIASLYEQGRVHHVGPLPQLEDQLTQWDPVSGTSPDRFDALVWALTDLTTGGNDAAAWIDFVARRGIEVAEPPAPAKTTGKSAVDARHAARTAAFRSGRYRESPP
jgi:Terminase RNaseH-like domain